MPFLVILLLWALPAWAGVSPECVKQLRTAEQRLIQQLDRHHSAYEPLQPIVPAKIVRSRNRARRQLIAWGMAFREISREERKDRDVQTAIEELIEDGDYSEDTTAVGTLFEVQSLPPFPTDARLSDLAFTHPEMPRVLKRLSVLNLPLFVDTSLTFAGFEGSFAEEWVALSIDSTIYDAFHELSHAEFEEYGVEIFLTEFRRANYTPEAFHRLARRVKHAGFGRARLRRAAELARQGYPIDAIDEVLAVEAEIEVGSRYIPLDEWDEWRREQIAYADACLLEELTDIGLRRALRISERNLLTEVLARSENNPDFLVFGKSSFCKAWQRYRRLAGSQLNARRQATLSAGRRARPTGRANVRSRGTSSAGVGR